MSQLERIKINRVLRDDESAPESRRVNENGRESMRMHGVG